MRSKGKATRGELMTRMRNALATLALALLLVPCRQADAAPPFTIEGPGVRPDDFRVTTFARGLDYPLGMQELADGSVLVAVSMGSSYWSSAGALLRLVDEDGDGVADGPGTVLAERLPGSQTSVRVAGGLVFVTGQRKPITVLRAGSRPADPLTRVGSINVNYPGGAWLHPHSALGVRATPDRPGDVDLFFQLGSRTNFTETTDTASLSSTFGFRGTLEGDSIYMLTVRDRGGAIEIFGLTRVASGLRNAAGLAFHPVSGDLFFQDNGIDGLGDPNEPTSADELNVLSAAAIGGAMVENFGFPSSYVAYRTGEIVGGEGIAPLVAFQPLPDPRRGDESEGPNDLTFAPPEFPDGLNHGIFIGFHGKFSGGGLANEENPLVYVDTRSGEYFHFIGVDEPAIGHLDGLLATRDSLFIADLSPGGGLSNGGGRGTIYQIKSLVDSRVRFLRGDPNGSGDVDVSDAVFVFLFLFNAGIDPECADAADVDDSGQIDITDGIAVLEFLFRGGPPPGPPFPSCGEDPPGEPGPGCEQSTSDC